MPAAAGVLRQISASQHRVDAATASGGTGTFRTADAGVVYRSAPWDGVQLDREAESTEIAFASDHSLTWHDDPRWRLAVIACSVVIPFVVRWLLY